MILRARNQHVRTGLILLVALLILAGPIVVQPSGVPFYKEARYTDLLISHLPNARFLQKSLSLWGQIPLWNPTNFAGAPFAADPLSGLIYPPAWIAGMLPFPLTFNLLVLVHLLLSAIGCYTLSRRLDLTPAAAMLSGLCFAGTPKLFAHIGLGHISLLFAVSWTPWLLVGVLTILRRQSSSRASLRAAVLTGSVQGLIFLADPRWSLPSLALAVGFGLHRWTFRGSEESLTLRRLIGPIAVAGGTALGVAAALGIPLWQYVQLTTRTQLTIAGSETFALNWEHLLGFASPILAQAEQVVYIGGVVLLLAVLGLISRTQGAGFWGVVLLLAIVFSLGTSTPFFPLLTRWIPGAGFLRVPSRALFLSALSAAFLAGMGYDAILQASRRTKPVVRLRWINLIVVVIVVGLNLGLVLMGVGSSATQLITAGITLIAGIMIWIYQSPRNLWPWLPAFLFVLILVDLANVSWGMIRVAPLKAIQADRRKLAFEIAHDYGEARIFSPSYSIPQLAAVDASLENLDGVNPLHLEAYADYLQRATGFKPVEYGVTLPPFPNGDPDEPWHVTIDPALFAQLNAGTIVSEYVLEDVSLELTGQKDGAYIYDFDPMKPRAWVSMQDGESWVKANIVSWSPNRIEINADGPGKLILSEIYYPGWVAKIDGQNIPIDLYDGLFRSVMIPAGHHEVAFVFQPFAVFLGLAITSLTVLVGLFLVWKR